MCEYSTCLHVVLLVYHLRGILQPCLQGSSSWLWIHCYPDQDKALTGDE